MLIEFLNSRVQLGAFLALDQQLGNFGTPFEILWFDFAHLALPRRSFAFPTALSLRFTLRGTECVLGELSPMLGECVPGLDMPGLTFILRQVLPRHTDNLGQGRVIGLDLCRHVLALDEGRTEEDERIGWAGDMVLRLLL